MATVNSSTVATAQLASAAAAAPDSVSPEERLLALIVYTQTAQLTSAQSSVNVNFDELSKLREQVRDALEKAKESHKHSGFWGAISNFLGSDLATIAEGVAALAAVVVTGGAATAVLAVIAAAAAIAAQHAKELGIPPEIAMGVAIVASVASLCCGNAKGLLDLGATVKTVAQAVKTTATVVAGVAVAGGGATHVAAASYDKDEAGAQADARFAQGQQTLVNGDIDEAIDRLSTALDRQSDAARVTSSIVAQDAQSNYLVLNHFGGAA
jgi:hypothetical protein